MRGRWAQALAATPLVVLAVSSAPAWAGVFRVTYSGSGAYRTNYHGEPPNHGGAPDMDSADDSSTQRWILEFAAPLHVPRCRCRRTVTLTGATGSTAVTGQIHHVHIDGLYPELDASSNCRVKYTTPRGRQLDVSASFRYNGARQAVVIAASSPVKPALTSLPRPTREYAADGDPASAHPECQKPSVPSLPRPDPPASGREPIRSTHRRQPDPGPVPDAWRQRARRGSSALVGGGEVRWSSGPR